MARFATGDLTSIWTWTLAVWGERCSCSSSEACRGDANNRTKSPQFGVFERGWGGGDGGTETGARTRTGKDGDLGERGDSASAEERRLINGPKAWLVTVGVATGGRGGPKPKQGRLGIGWLQTKPSLFHPRPCWAANGFLERRPATEYAARLWCIPCGGLVGSGPWPAANLVEQYTREPTRPVWTSTACSAPASFMAVGTTMCNHGFFWGEGGKRLHLGGQAFFFSLLFQYGVPAASSKHAGVAGAEGAESSLPGFGVCS